MKVEPFPFIQPRIRRVDDRGRKVIHMQTYTLEKTGLELSLGKLMKKDKKGVIEATFDVAKIKRVSIVSSMDPWGTVFSIGALGLTFVLFLFMPNGLWRWLTVVISGTIFLACTLGIKTRYIVIEVGDDKLEYQTLELPERIPSFVAMINQAIENEKPNKTAPCNPAPQDT